MDFVNQSKIPLYVAVLELCSDGKVDVLYPLHQHTGKAIPADGKPHHAENYVIEGPIGQRSLFKVIATSTWVDFKSLITATRKVGESSTGSAFSPLQRLVQQQLAGKRTGGTTAASLETALWGTTETWLRIIP